MRSPLPRAPFSTRTHFCETTLMAAPSDPDTTAQTPGDSGKQSAEKPAARKSAGLERYGSLYGSSPAMLELYEQIERVAATDATALIVGESGTGKELIARTIHEHSTRKSGAFVAVNCGAIPDELIEAELFGHEKGSFTGAVQGRIGYF